MGFFRVLFKRNFSTKKTVSGTCSQKPGMVLSNEFMWKFQGKFGGLCFLGTKPQLSEQPTAMSI